MPPLPFPPEAPPAPPFAASCAAICGLVLGRRAVGRRTISFVDTRVYTAPNKAAGTSRPSSMPLLLRTNCACPILSLTCALWASVLSMQMEKARMKAVF